MSFRTTVSRSCRFLISTVWPECGKQRAIDSIARRLGPGEGGGGRGWDGVGTVSCTERWGLRGWVGIDISRNAMGGDILADVHSWILSYLRVPCSITVVASCFTRPVAVLALHGDEKHHAWLVLFVHYNSMAIFQTIMLGGCIKRPSACRACYSHQKLW